MIDTPLRSMLKALSWRLIGLIVLSTITLLVTGSLKETSFVALSYHGGMVFLYFIHERLWSKLGWGKSSGLFIQMTGMSGAGKTTLARLAAENLRKSGVQVEVIDGDEYRSGLCSDLGFSKEDRNKNIRRLGFVSKVLARNNVVSIISAINPYDSVREELAHMGENVKTVYIKCDIETLKGRDTKGLYRRALLPDGHPEKVYNFTGISDPFEVPLSPDLTIDTSTGGITSCAKVLEGFILRSIS